MIILPSRHESHHLQVRKEQWYLNALLILVLSVTLSGSVGADAEIYRSSTFLVTDKRASYYGPELLSSCFGASP